ncbi:glutathione S-transferase family protein [Variovorax sp. J22G21]|uniref:glutathione S-transferase family protein n=1 Tax=Variovorax fucosicus TaxID=3053517 RepID=UPI0025783572|nr:MULTISPECIES: glutathione S-transferase family protein [unclassified Variovorax]MDM0040664.1 glutathione S-transferase family protein [Variovorax sp. J22R193]MDM0058782.1 glutathione S-transferase family protein [Variovorax sp. J22G47]MDM0062037.1 glutathione S-transferase family protein [Variovorax sp. J22G21]
MTQADRYTLYGAPGSGATPVHAALTLIGAECTAIDVSPWEGEHERNKLTVVNPLQQVPALVLPSGEVMTESAAILIWLGDRYPEAQLCPAPDDPLRARYLRWMVYVPAAIYSMYWVRDEPSRLTPEAAAQATMLTRTAERIAECWHLMDAQLQGDTPWLLGDRIGMLDLYVAVVSRWTPGRARFYREAPRMAEVVRRVDAEPRLADFWAARYPFAPGWGSVDP